MMPTHHRNGGNRLAVLAIMAAVAQLSGNPMTDESLYHMAMCDLCAKGVPLVNGKHVLLGAEIECDAEQRDTK